MCCCCCGPARKRATVSFLSLFLLPCCLALLLFSVADYDTPWFRLILERNTAPASEETKAIPVFATEQQMEKRSVRFMSPLAFSVPSFGIFSPFWEKRFQSKFSPPHHAVENNVEDVRRVLDVNNTSDHDNSINNNEDAAGNGGGTGDDGEGTDNHVDTDSFTGLDYDDISTALSPFPSSIDRIRLPRNPLAPESSTPSPTPAPRRAAYIVSVWSLRTVSIYLPDFGFSRQIQIEKISGDPFLAAALSVGGVYQAILDATNVNSLIIHLTYWSLPCLAIGMLIAFIVLLVDCISAIIYRTRKEGIFSHYRTRERNAAGARSLQVPLHPSRRERRLLVGDSRSLGSERHAATAPGVAREPVLLVGVMAVIGTVFLVTGFIIWTMRDLTDSRVILGALARFFGRRAANWVTQRMVLEIEIGAVAYVAAAVLLAVVGLVNIFTDVSRVKRREHRMALSDDREGEYEPQEGTTGERPESAARTGNPESPPPYMPPPLPV